MLPILLLIGAYVLVTQLLLKSNRSINGLKLSSIEIILEECGWEYNKVTHFWTYSKYKIKRTNIHKAIKQGEGRHLRETVIEKLQAETNPMLKATVERLRTKKNTAA